jgi:hypothetical protein
MARLRDSKVAILRPYSLVMDMSPPILSGVGHRAVREMNYSNKAVEESTTPKSPAIAMFLSALALACGRRVHTNAPESLRVPLL